jgi:23S rRNA (cytosine1962-C5)-methyltransferase
MSDSADTRPRIRLLPRADKRLRSGHPWAFANELRMDAPARALDPGTLVTLESAEGQALGVAMFNYRSLIAARLLDAKVDRRIDAAFLAERLARAAALREQFVGGTHWRWVHAEADGLPGLVIDRYGEVVVLQANAAGMERLLEPLLEAVERVVGPRCVVLRNDSSVRFLEGLGGYVRVAKGELAPPVAVEENGLVYWADPSEGQKTGWFFDQRANRAFVAAAAKGARVLDLYCHTGGFAVAAAAAGARQVLAVDRSAPAIALAGQAASRNKVAQKIRFETADVFDRLAEIAASKERFEVVVVDPPAFVKAKKDHAAGLRGYRKLLRLAAGAVRPGGLLFAASCSQPVTVEEFVEQCRLGLADAGRGGRILRISGADVDHPVHPALPQSTYLKAVALALD